MIAYVDASVALRLVLGQPEPLDTWSDIDLPITSELTRVEGARTIDRARIRGDLTDAEVAQKHQALTEQTERFLLLPLDHIVMRRAADTFPTTIGTLDALHLATALIWRDEEPNLVLATHDSELAIAARALGFDVYGS